MREIKFRAWDSERNIIIGSDYPKNWSKDEYEEWWLNEHRMMLQGIEDIVEIKRFSVMQYTGLKDKNGAEIWEGDIIETEIVKRKGVIEYDKSIFGVNWDYGTDNKTMLGSWGTETNLRVLHDGFYREVQVIGNIYENPELGGE